MKEYNRLVTLNLGQVKAGNKYHVANGCWDMFVKSVEGDIVTYDCLETNGDLVSKDSSCSILVNINMTRLHPYDLEEKGTLEREFVHYEVYRELENGDEYTYVKGNNLEDIVNDANNDFTGDFKVKRVVTTTQELFSFTANGGA